MEEGQRRGAGAPLPLADGPVWTPSWPLGRHLNRLNTPPPPVVERVVLLLPPSSATKQGVSLLCLQQRPPPSKAELSFMCQLRASFSEGQSLSLQAPAPLSPLLTPTWAHSLCLSSQRIRQGQEPPKGTTGDAVTGGVRGGGLPPPAQFCRG